MSLRRLPSSRIRRAGHDNLLHDDRAVTRARQHSVSLGTEAESLNPAKVYLPIISMSAVSFELERTYDRYRSFGRERFFRLRFLFRASGAT